MSNADRAINGVSLITILGFLRALRARHEGWAIPFSLGKPVGSCRGVALWAPFVRPKARRYRSILPRRTDFGESVLRGRTGRSWASLIDRLIERTLEDLGIGAGRGDG